jgi:outer membrane protein OmpA-like peptidoglycan-associated protein
MRGLVASLAALSIAAAGCAAQPVLVPPRAAHDETVVLLPGRDGKTGGLAVTSGARQQLLAAPYASSRVGDDGRLEDAGRVDADQVRQIFTDALGAQPPRPTTYVLYFVEGTDGLTPDSAREMTTVLREIGRYPAVEVVVIGHTDRTGSVAYNDALSLRRAERMADHLVAMGIRRDQIRLGARGEREPLVATEDEVAEPRNRRVEITVR